MTNCVVAIRTVLTLLLLTMGASAQGWELPRAVDRNPDPAIFETVITVREAEVQLLPGKKTRMFTFNGTFPGPTIEATVGTRLIVHVINLLPEPTTIHWHGVGVPARMDGTEHSQAAIPKSGYFRYEFVLNNAATYWYHSHVRTNEQIERGLYGALIVRDPKHDAAVGVPRANERVLLLDDISLDENNQIKPFSTDVRANLIPWERAQDLVNSRVGNHVLVNGRVVTSDRLPTFVVKSQDPQRLRLINAANGRIFRLDVAKGDSKWFGVGSDQGLWNAAEPIVPIDQVPNVLGHHNELISNPDTAVGATLTPADRLESVLVPTGADGAKVYVNAHDFVKGKHIAYRDPAGDLWFGHDHFDGAAKPQKLLCFEVKGRVAKPWQPPKALRWDPVGKMSVPPKQPLLPIFFGHGLPDRTTGSAMFFISVANANGLLAKLAERKMIIPADYDPQPFMKLRENDGIAVRIGETRQWEIVNFTGSDHNFHMHGFRFQHIETEYVDLDEPKNTRKEQPRRVCFEDTIRTPRRPGLVLGRSYTIVRLAMRFDDSDRPAALRRMPQEMLAHGYFPGANRSGGWSVHCHFLEHAVQGMMSFVTVSR